MSFDDFKLFYVLACVSLGLIILSPTLAMVIRLPAGERFSELWILGSGHMAEDYPFNVKTGETYKVYLGVSDHMGALEYYMVCLKFRNGTESLPDTVNGTPSNLTPILEYRLFLEDNETWEREVSFSFEGVSFEGNMCKVSRIIIDGYSVGVDKVASWDEDEHGFYFQLFFELWIYNTDASKFQYHNRFVGIWLNMTRSL